MFLMPCIHCAATIFKVPNCGQNNGNISSSAVSDNKKKSSHLAFDVFFQKLFVHSVHLDFAAVIIVINHVGAKL